MRRQTEDYTAEILFVIGCYFLGRVLLPTLIITKYQTTELMITASMALWKGPPATLLLMAIPGASNK